MAVIVKDVYVLKEKNRETFLYTQKAKINPVYLQIFLSPNTERSLEQ